MKLSYSQRLEDYHLASALGDRESGTYIDVGAGHPVADNVSYWFYLKGWRGLVVEPQRALLDLYAHLRPRDIAVPSLVGEHDGEMEFHVVERLHGMSTTIADHARGAAAFGAGFETVRMPVRTLASLAAEHGVGPVDFLKVDVEGAEAAVLAGMDWKRCRPRIVLVEAVSPGSMAEAWRDWEPMLLAQGYRFALFDELNRFYVAEEEHEFARRLPAVPARWDSAAHLYDCGRAHERADHPDHRLAAALVRGFLAALPTLDPALLSKLLGAHAGPQRETEAGLPERAMQLLFGAAEFPGASPRPLPGMDRPAIYRHLMDSDRFRAALGRISAAYDGGYIMD
ncbi:MAG: FkbM family methyltransferase [Hyphomicrobiaceae bacterium]|nr:FkbM family methyltransferase [Hyphomicrobiaceae bacterium]